jgi:hypothetical protein
MAILGNKKSEKKRKKYHHYNSKRIRTQNPEIRWFCVAGTQTSCRCCDFRSSHISCYLHLPYIYESTAADSASKKIGFTAASC